MNRNLTLILFTLTFAISAWGAEETKQKLDKDRLLKICALKVKEGQARAAIDKFKSGKTKAEINCFEGKNAGTYTSYFENTKMESKGGFDKGELSGHWVRWYENGQKRDDGVWKAGKPDGEWNLWHENGEKKGEYHFVNGRRNGDWQEWAKNGKLLSEGEFNSDIKVGEWTEWNSKKSKYLTVEYDDFGRIVSPSKNTAVAGRGLNLLNLRGSMLYLTSGSNGKSYTVEGGWSPYYRFHDLFAIAADLALSPVRDSTGSVVLLMSYGVHLLNFWPSDDRFILELGFGAQTWTSQTTDLYIGGNLLYRPKKKFLWIISGTYFGYKTLVSGNDAIDTFRAGFEVRL